MEDPRIISALFIFLKMAYYNVLINNDAIWQTAFGGTLYQIPGTGSHGCINMPLDQAGALFNMIEPGTPVIFHW